MKVVINSANTNFGLSDEAIELCIKYGMIVDSPGCQNYLANFIKYDYKGFPNKYLILNPGSKHFRCNPAVIKAVEELGERANTDYTNLKIIDIPFDTIDGWDIEDNGYTEIIIEQYRVWS